jgi:tRNA G18 (ribose-2'-O)-methylase SpoU
MGCWIQRVQCNLLQVAPLPTKCYNIQIMEDTRNLIDEYKGLTNEEVFAALDKKRSPLEVAIENVEHDFNIGTVVRNANSFNVSKVHIIRKKKYIAHEKTIINKNHNSVLNTFVLALILSNTIISASKSPYNS